MKRTAPARSRNRRQRAVSVSLFPFLAVLISTMGALILLLVIIAKQARLQAAEDTAARNADVQRDLRAAREWAQLEISEYRYSREKTEGQLAEARMALGHVEDHARRLREQLAWLEATWNELRTLEADGADRREELEAELERLKHEIAQCDRELAEAQRAAGRRGSYAIVPYQGPHATRRRPIYVECRQDAVVLQPEGIVLGEDDFAGPLGPGNPLDVALRAVREYLLRHQKFDSEGSGEPYPLLLVRPAGIEAYYAARAAMKSWASEFGYELIGGDWKLDFPPPDTQLAEEVGRAVATARARQKRLIAAAPRRFSRKLRPGYVASAYRGGLVPRGGAGHTDPDQLPQRSFGSPGHWSPSGNGNQERPGFGPDDATTGQTPSGQEPASRQAGTAGQPGFNTSVPSRPDRQQGGVATTGMQSPRDNSRSSDGDSLGQGDSPMLAPPGPGQSPGDAGSLSISPTRPQSLAKVRGRDWGLPNAARGSIPITSPIRIDCHPDRLVLVPERGLGQGKVIGLGPRTEDSVDELISTIWQYIELWGSAGSGMYWRPVLSVHVAPNAELRYAHLKTLLDGSGLEVRRNDE